MKQYKQNKSQPRMKTKEEGWNNRFYLGKIPNYESMQDRNSKTLF